MLQGSGRRMSIRVNGRKRRAIDVRDRGLQYGDGLFETMRVRRGRCVCSTSTSSA